MTRETLVVFDAEGVIIPKGVFLYKIIQKHRPEEILNLVIPGVKYLLGLSQIKSSITQIYSILKDLPPDIINNIIEDIPLKPGAQQVFKELKQHGYKTALITSGIPQQALESLKNKLDIDYIIGPTLTTENGLLTGKVKGTVLEKDGKAKALSTLLLEQNMQDYKVISIADDRNNIPLFKNSDTSIGYHPDFLLYHYSDHVVTHGLLNILPIILDKPRPRVNPGKSTILRKIVHASSILIPLILLEHLGKYPVVALLLLAMTLYTVSEATRILGDSLPFFTWFTHLNTTDTEASEFVDAPLFYALGIILTLLIFPRETASAAIAVLALGDSAAALTGSLTGKHKLPYCKEKTIEGTIAGFIAAYIAANYFLSPSRALVAALSGTLAETLPMPFNDNLIIPLIVGLTLTIF